LKQVIKGNQAVALGAKLSRVQVISAYPITPQTTIVEELSEMCAQGELDSKFIKVESEHSAMAWADQSDSLSQRDTGWIQIYCESNQEVLDSVIMAFRLAEQTMLPVMLCFDGFFLSHTSEIVDVPERVQVDKFLPSYQPEYKLDLSDPRMFGGIIGPEYYYEQRFVMHQDSQHALDRYLQVCREFFEIFGRKYGLIETYRSKEAELIVVAAGTITSVARIAVDRLREAGRRVGLVKVRMFRPLPIASWQNAFGEASKVVVIDRNLSAGLGGIFASEVQAALYSMQNRPVVFPVVAGLGGRDVTPDDVEAVVKEALASDTPKQQPIFWGLKH
jgi:pyruvate/2-oxoacid:ferredoxin oxidoreductase alpha subunit